MARQPINDDDEDEEPARPKRRLWIRLLGIALAVGAVWFTGTMVITFLLALLQTQEAMSQVKVPAESVDYDAMERKYFPITWRTKKVVTLTNIVGEVRNRFERPVHLEYRITTRNAAGGVDEVTTFRPSQDFIPAGESCPFEALALTDPLGDRRLEVKLIAVRVPK